MRIMQSYRNSLLRSEIITHLTIRSVRTSISRSPRRWRGILCSLAVASTLVFLLLTSANAFGGSATWNLNPTDEIWGTASNWTPATVPNGPNDTATFGVSNTTDVINGVFVGDEVNGIVFDAGASPFTITIESIESFPFVLTISGVGITNNSGITQNFVTFFTGDETGVIHFTNSATAGDLTVFTNNDRGTTEFFDTSRAGSGTFKNNDGDYDAGFAGITNFFDSATADSATLIAYGGAGDQRLGGTISFQGDSTGGTARVEVFASNPGFPDGNLDISAHNAPGVTVGSIEGTGAVFLGANKLTVGSNNLRAHSSGVIQDRGIGGGVGGSLTKIGTGTLTLTGVNTYTGGTTINRGTLLISNSSGSGTGTGAVQVNAGRLGGKGTVAGAVTVGTGSHPGAILAPGISGAGTLTIQSTLTLNADATYNFQLNSRTARADKVVANGVTINAAQFSFVGLGNALTVGTVYTVIDNTAATPIAGTFSNLADGSIFTVNGHSFQASYEGGDGNDLTLTVLP